MTFSSATWFEVLQLWIFDSPYVCQDIHVYGAFVMIGAPSHFFLDGGALFIPLHYISGHGLSSTSLSFRWWRSFHSLHFFFIFCVCIMYVFSVCFLGTMSLAYICWRSSYSFQVFQHCFSVLLFKLDCAVHVSSNMSLFFRWRRSFYICRITSNQFIV